MHGERFAKHTLARVPDSPRTHGLLLCSNYYPVMDIIETIDIA